MSMQISLIIKVFIVLLITNAFVYSVMKKECYMWRMFMTFMALTMKPIQVLLFTLSNCNDTDILVIILSNIQKLAWLDMGLDYNNSCTFIDVK